MQYIVNVEAAIIPDDKYLLIVRGAGESHAAGVLAFVGGKMEETQNANDVLEDSPILLPYRTSLLGFCHSF